MKVSCLQENLARGLSVVGHAVGSRVPLPVLSNILITTESSQIKLVATDMQVVITARIQCDVDETGATTAPAKLLTDFVGNLPNDTVLMSLDGQTQKLKIKSGRYSANVNGMDAEDFPILPEVKESPLAVIGSHALKELVAKAAFAAASDDARPVLAGVLMNFEGNKVTLVAADGFRLAMAKAELDEPVRETTSVIVPAKAVNILSRIIGDEDQPVEISVAGGQNQILFHTANVSLVSRLVDGTFPNYNQIIPQNYTSRAVLNTAEFLKAAKIAAIFSKESANVVRIDLAEGKELTPAAVTVAANAAEVGDNTTELEGSIEGPGGRIAFNSNYLIDVLNVIGASQVALEMQSASSPGVLKPVGDDASVHVIMPMHLAGGR